MAVEPLEVLVPPLPPELRPLCHSRGAAISAVCTPTMSPSSTTWQPGWVLGKGTGAASATDEVAKSSEGSAAGPQRAEAWHSRGAGQRERRQRQRQEKRRGFCMLCRRGGLVLKRKENCDCGIQLCGECTGRWSELRCAQIASGRQRSSRSKQHERSGGGWRSRHHVSFRHSGGACEACWLFSRLVCASFATTALRQCLMLVCCCWQDSVCKDMLTLDGAAAWDTLNYDEGSPVSAFAVCLH